MKIGFVSELSPTRREAWSGTIGYLLDALRIAGGDVHQIGPTWEWQTVFLNRTSKVLKRITGRDPMLNRSGIVAGLKAKALLRQAREGHAEVLFAPAGSALIAKMSHEMPVAYSSDATVRLLLDYYPNYTGLHPQTIARSIALEREAMQRADLLIYPTQWAANSAIQDYGIPAERIIVQPFGANLKEPPAREMALAPRKPGPLRLLFCGVEWQRKGGDIALETLRLLLAENVEAELCILGCTPPAGTDLPPGVEVIPFLDKNIPEQQARFREIFMQSDILILPTRAECYGLVFCEAAAFGTISLATRTGGIPEVIREGETGFSIPPEEGAQAYAAHIHDILNTPGRLEQMRRAARDDFEQRLNWDVWGKAVLPRIEALSVPGPAQLKG